MSASFEDLSALLLAIFEDVSEVSLRHTVEENLGIVHQWKLLDLLGPQGRADTELTRAAEWLALRPQALALFLSSGDTISAGEEELEAERWGSALRLLRELLEDDPDADEADGSVRLRLAVAVALTFSGQVTSFADNTPIDGLARFYSFLVGLEAGEFHSSFRDLGAWQMRSVVGSWATDDELAWARSVVPAEVRQHTLAIGTVASQMVKYKDTNDEGVSVHAGDAYYGGRPKTLQEMHATGGVCGAISKFSSGMCQAFGIPAMPVGQPGHCAFIWRPDVTGKWIVGNDCSGMRKSTRHVGVQMTWGNEAWLVPLMEDAQQNLPLYMLSECLRSVSRLLRGQAFRLAEPSIELGACCELAAVALDTAKTVCPQNFAAWKELLTDIQAETSPTVFERGARLTEEAARSLERHPSAVEYIRDAVEQKCPCTYELGCEGPIAMLDGGGWKLVRRVQAGSTWHPATDGLSGTDAYGVYSTEPTSNCTFSVRFKRQVFDEFLFATGDGSKWLIVCRDEAVKPGSNEPRWVEKSSLNSERHQVRWYMRETPEDPWISLTDHADAAQRGDILYGGNGFGGAHAANVLPSHNGANVFIRTRPVMLGCDGTIAMLDGGGWKLVRRICAGNTWHPATDGLAGTEAYGRYSTNPECPTTFSARFSGEAFDQFMFATGDGTKWLIVEREEALKAGSNEPRWVEMSSINANRHTVRWYMRGTPEDPWISLVDHADAVGQGNILYGGDNFGGAHALNVLPSHNGANVFIRKRPQLE